MRYTKEEYIAMRKSGQIDLGWMYNFYLDEFEKLSPTYEAKIKDMHGGFLFVEVRPGEYLHKTETKTREQISFPAFAQAFSLGFTMMGAEILEYLDKKMNVSKIEEKTSTKYKNVESTESKLFYIG